MTAEQQQREIAQLRWRCRRGMRELDELLTRYLEQVYPQASSAERSAFAQLLDLQDPDIFGYLVGRNNPPQGPLSDVITQLRYSHPPSAKTDSRKPPG